MHFWCCLIEGLNWRLFFAFGTCGEIGLVLSFVVVVCCLLAGVQFELLLDEWWSFGVCVCFAILLGYVHVMEESSECCMEMRK